jgi:SAM-dependent methyltransferase
MTDPSAEPTDTDAVLRLVQQELARWRPTAWEDDISAHALDEEPFENAGVAADLVGRLAEYEHLVRDTPTPGDLSLDELVIRDTFAMPGPTDREGYSVGYDGHFWVSGLVDFLKVNQVLEQRNLRPASMLELGAASGRALRHFAVHSDIEEIWATDLNRRHVRWLLEFMPAHVRAIFNSALPTLPLRDNSVDLVTAFSVFTHIDTFETAWLAELARIISDRGLCYLTVHNDDTWNALADHDPTDNRLIEAMTQSDPETPSKLQGPVPRGRTVYRFRHDGPYRANVFLSNDHIERVWGRFFTIEEITPRHHGLQSVVVARRK